MENMADNKPRLSADVVIVPTELQLIENGKGKDGMQSACGWFTWRPRCLRRFSSPRWLLCVLSTFIFFQSMSINGLTNGALSTLQRRFELSSFQTGLLPSIYDVTAAILLVFIGYAGNTRNKPRMLGFAALFIGLGNLVFTLPHFTTGSYSYATTNSTDTCSAFEEAGADPSRDNDQSISSLSAYLWVFLLSQVLFALGSAPLYSVGYAFIDESVTSRDAGVYIGIFSMCVTLGPAVGFVISGLQLNLYTDFHSVATESLDIEPSDVQWVGAWWLSFIGCAIVAFLISIPVSGFPAELPGTKKIREERESQAHANADKKGKTERSDFGRSWRDFPSALRILLRNFTFVALTLSITASNLFATGAEVFLPIYLENQYGLTSGLANIIIGVQVLIAGGGALFTGGWMIKRFNLKVRGMMKLIIVTNVFTTLLIFSIYLSCPELPLAGIYQQYSNGSAITTLNLDSSCNSGCHCSTGQYSPVCGSNDVMYFSPCYAGCQGQEDEANETVYTDCTCPQQYVNATSVDPEEATAVPGRCGTYCTEMYVFLVFLLLILVALFIDSVAATNTLLRCVPDGQQSFALGIYGLISRLLGSLPGPIVFGRIVDSTCTLWHEVDGVRGQCWFHDRRDLSIYVVIFGVSANAVAMVLNVIAYKAYKPPVGQKDTN